MGSRMDYERAFLRGLKMAARGGQELLLDSDTHVTCTNNGGRKMG